MHCTVSHCNLCHATALSPLFEKDGFLLVRCQACGLVCVGNPPDDEQRAKLYSFESGYHQELGDDAVSIAFHREEARRNLAVLARHARPARLLDIGCSSGLFLAAARTAGWQVRGLEYSPDSARMAREQHGLDVVTGELSADTFAPGSFDVVTMWDVVEHLPDPARTLELAAPLLAPGGLLVLKTPNIDGIYPQASLAVAGKLGFWGHPEPPGHLYQFSQSTLSRMVERAGFGVSAVHHQRIPIAYSFGDLRGWFRSAKWLAYCVAFAPLAIAGPWVRQGDDLVLVAECRRVGAR